MHLLQSTCPATKCATLLHASLAAGVNFSRRRERSRCRHPLAASARRKGIEPLTCGLEDRCSIQLS